MILTDVEYAELKMKALFDGLPEVTLRNPMTFNHKFWTHLPQETKDELHRTQDILIITDDEFLAQVDSDFNSSAS